MKPFNNYAETKSYQESEKLPVGGYILKVMNVAYVDGGKDKSDQIVIAFDICEGEFNGFYKKNFDSQNGEDKKWKGTYRLWVPNDDGSEKDDWSKRRFKTVIEAFEESNSGFAWDWDEKKLKGKLVGGVFNQKEYEYKGKRGFFTQCAKLVTTESIRSDTFKIPSDVFLEDKPTGKPDDSFMQIDKNTDEEIPFL